MTKIKDSLDTSDAFKHFTNRSKTYNSSSNWVVDEKFLKLMIDSSKVDPSTELLDIAVGTGLVSKAFKPFVKSITGIDICDSMASQSSKWIDKFVQDSAEQMPFENESFNHCVCRQGLQFMDLDKVLPEVHRILKNNGKVTFAHLTTFGEDDKEETFAIQKLRNPARVNYFDRVLMVNKLEEYNFNIDSVDYFISKESVEKWINNGAISNSLIENIRDLYKNSSEQFKSLHKIRFEENDVIDSMSFQIITASK